VRLPRDVSGGRLAKALEVFGYRVSHQTGSDVRLTTQRGGEHHVTILAHDPLRVGTLSSIIHDVAQHQGMTRGQVLEALFG